ncbi:MAG TPA: SAM-dependent methyltransferase [Burkholderiaceae bacterium]|nr:SAM-dependent methyltransferase [Burkholderiaceae bacterium]
MSTASPTPATLYLLPTPLSDAAVDEVLPPAVVQRAHALNYFLAENAKSARAFLKRIGHPVPLQQLLVIEIGHTPDAERVDEWLQPLLEGRDAALVSEAGCPGIADPGDVLVARARQLGLPVRPLVGPNAIVLALMASGLNGQQFRFVGYLPAETAARTAALRALESVARSGETQLFIETPYRNDRLFESILATCAPDTRLTVALDLTGSTEAIFTRRVAEWRALPASERPSLQRRPAMFALGAAAVPARAKR